MNINIEINNTIFDITEEYPETIDVFAANGFPQMKDAEKRISMGKSLSLDMALTLKQLDKDEFLRLLKDQVILSRGNIDKSLDTHHRKISSDSVKMQGLLPCPVRLPLNEGLETFAQDYELRNKREINYDLKAASMGLDWLKDELLETEDEDKLADIFISAGFDLFFDKKLMGKFKSKGVFGDMTPFEKLNSDFDNDQISLRDPDGDYSMMAVVPAVFMVNTKELNGRAVPRTWVDLLKPEYENSVSLPISDFDLFNAILLHLHKNYGEEAIMALGKSLLQSMHPSQMIKSEKKNNIQRPAITIMPYFFTKTVKAGSSMQAIWPEDGAIISPIFMLSKKKKQKELQEVIDFMLSKPVGEILSHQGLFPSINPHVNNNLSEDKTFMWLGWDYIKSNDIAELITHCENIFFSNTTNN